MRALAFGVVGLLLGVGLGWLVAPCPPRQHSFRVDQEVTLLNVNGAPLGTIPVGTILLSECDFDPKGELGWWGYVPVYFGTQAEAARFLVPTNTRIESITQITLGGGSRDEAVAPPTTSTPLPK